MKEIGLHPSATGEPGGKETGKHMSHYIVSGGPPVSSQNLIKTDRDVINVAVLNLEAPARGRKPVSAILPKAKEKARCGRI
jgi:hypothetical protein